MSADLSLQLRVQPDTHRLAPQGATDIWSIRVQVAEAWDAVRLDVVPETPVIEVKQVALLALMPDANQPDNYEVKLAGELVDERQTVQQAGIRDGSILLVIGRRRKPVR